MTIKEHRLRSNVFLLVFSVELLVPSALVIVAAAVLLYTAHLLLVPRNRKTDFQMIEPMFSQTLVVMLSLSGCTSFQTYSLLGNSV